MSIIQHTYSYSSALADSLKVNWKVDDLIGGPKKLDFQRPFLPDSLVRVAEIRSLNTQEKLLLNQIRGATYLHLFGLVEEFILPFALERAQDEIHGDKSRVRALLTFAEEEAKHQQLFHRFSEEFAASFPVKVEFIGPAREIASAVLQHSTLGVAVLILHLEWLTQKHFTESVKTDESLDPLFVDLLRHHWQEEAQHAKIDTLVAAELARQASAEQIEKAVDDFLSIGALLDGGLQQQVKLDLDTLERAIQRKLSTTERDEIANIQLKSYRWTFLVSGLEHPNFSKAVADLSASGWARVQEVARALS